MHHPPSFSAHPGFYFPLSVPNAHLFVSVTVYPEHSHRFGNRGLDVAEAQPGSLRGSAPIEDASVAVLGAETGRSHLPVRIIFLPNKQANAPVNFSEGGREGGCFCLFVCYCFNLAVVCLFSLPQLDSIVKTTSPLPIMFGVEARSALQE